MAQVHNKQRAPYINLQKGPALNSRDKRELRRLKRRLSESGRVQFEIRPGKESKETLKEVLALKRAWIDKYGLPSSVIGESNWESAILAMANTTDCVRVATLAVNGELVAGEIALVFERKWHAFVGAFSPRYSKFGPGQIQMEKTMEYCRAENYEIYDLLPPLQDYKAAMATGVVDISDFLVALTTPGQLVISAAKMMPTAKYLLTAIPPAIWRG
jgi:CelD/BcsL family acetyltransferase involved in cellulose biosynthesis